VLGPLYSVAAYSDLLDQFRQWGLVEDRNLFIFHYDWRMSNFDSADQLSAFVTELINKGKIGSDQKFNIVAHSMGGLVARLYLEKPERRAKVHKLIYLGTPFLGSMNTLGTLSEGWTDTLGLQNWLAGGEASIRRTIISFPGFLELLPRYVPSSTGHCCEVKEANGAYSEIHVFDPSTWAQLHWLTPPHDSGRDFQIFSANLRRSESLTPILAAKPKDVIEVLFAGDPKDTRFIFTVDRADTSPSPSHWKFSFQPGDGTVSEWSAARNPRLDNISGALQSFYAHANIFDDKWVRSELHRELFNAEAVVVRPIAGSGHPQLTVSSGGVSQAAQVETVAIRPSVTYLKVGSPLTADVLLTLQADSGSWLKPGMYAPIISLRQGANIRLLNLQETSTVRSAANAELSFAAFGSTANFQAGIAEIAVTLQGAPSEPIVSEFVVLMP
jgi:pimeloyl-ACP methyl ester carboxylesterase